MQKTAGFLIALALLAGLPAAQAEICTIDAVPAATLLLPFFEVDLDDPDSLTTLFSINNASAEPAIAHVVLWTDLSVPTLDFNVYLTGYDVVTVNMRDVFNGIIPQTTNDNSPAGLSPVGPYSVATSAGGIGPGTASCSSQLPTGNLPPVLLNHIRNAHTGNFSDVLGGCGGTDRGDNRAIGYLTIDSVNTCTLFSPQDGDLYFGNPAGVNNRNILWGDWFLVDTQNNFAQGDPLVHVEADDSLGPLDYTFYRRYVAGSSDQREGLASIFAARYSTTPLVTQYIAWRDAQQPISAFTCGTLPDPYPLAQNAIVIFDEMENPEVIEEFPFSPPINPDLILPFPWETQRTTVGGPAFPVSFTNGWIYMDLGSTISGATFMTDGLAQAWVVVLSSALGQFSAAYDAIQLNNVTFFPMSPAPPGP